MGGQSKHTKVAMHINLSALFRGAVECKVKADTILLDPARKELHFSYHGVRVASMPLPDLDLRKGDTITITDLEILLDVTINY